MTKTPLPKELRVGATRFSRGVALEVAQECIDRHIARYREIERVLEMGLRLGESGKHGDGDKCPTCHFVREARKALAGWG